jgi:hypothetical protein
MIEEQESAGKRSELNNVKYSESVYSEYITIFINHFEI